MTGICFLAAFVISLMPGDTSKYARYEQENMSKFRHTFSFTYPEINGVAIRPAETWHFDSEDLPGDSSKVIYDVPPQLNMLLALHMASNQGEEMEGFRVQIYAGGDLKVANESRADFVEIYSDIPTYRMWVQPTFRIRAGDFVSRNEAVAFCNALRSDFPGAFVVPDTIKKPVSRKEKLFREQELRQMEERLMLEKEEGEED